MKKKDTLRFILIIALMIIAPSLINSGKPLVRTKNNTKNSPELKILSWNIYMLPHCSWINGNCKRARAIAENLKSSDYDIIVFEEAFDGKARKILRKQFEDAYPFMYGPANASLLSIRTSSGIWILSKIPLKKIKEIKYKNCYGIDAMARKGAVMFEGEWNGNQFQLVGTHLQADSPDEVRREQCNEIADLLLNKFSKANVPQIVCGDFNIEMDDTENYHYMLNVLKVENGQIDGDIHTSYDEIENSLAKRQNGKKRLIDYVFVRNGKLIKNVKRHISVFKQYQNNILLELSDHYGIEASIYFEPQSEFPIAHPFITKN